MEKLIGQQLADGGTAGLLRRLEKLHENGSDNAVRSLTVDICFEIEAAQWSFSPEKITELAEDTGIPKEKLLLPANLYGRWLMMISDTVMHPVPAIVYSQSDVAEKIRTDSRVANILDSPYVSDASIRIWREKPWVRIEIINPLNNNSIQLNFTRCRPDAKGIHWVQATWLDEFFIEDTFTALACNNFNFVTNFEGRQCPSDIRRLRFLITERNENNKFRSMIVTGRFNEIPDEIKKSCKKHKQNHTLYLSRLESDLLDALHPYISKFPGRFSNTLPAQ
jgi:hypothetical protein